MANAKEYGMLFKLSAQLGREWGSTFSTAERTLGETQKEIKALNQAQSDISAYQKQQHAVESTARKLSDLKKEYDNIQREIQETEGFSSSLENKAVEKQRAIDKTGASLKNQTDKLRQMEGAMKDAGIDTEHLTDESARLSGKLDDLAEKQAKAAEAAQNFGTEGAGSFEAIGDAMIAAGIAVGLKKIYDAYKECVSVAADFQETMSTVEALSGANAEEMQSLSGFAKELGATTKFTAKESAEAMTYMGMAGWDAQEMMSGMNGVLTLAAAAGEDLAMTSDIVTDNLTAFGMTAADTAHFSDVLALAATASNTSVGLMGETFKNSAALAGALKYSVEDVAVAVGLMANAGIKGSHAGIALKNIFNGLLNGVELSAAALGDVKYSAVNADGTMKSFGQTLQDLRGYFAQMTGAEQVHNAKLLAGERAMAGFVSIMNASEDDYRSLTDTINNCAGAAQKMADIKMNNLNGQLTLLSSAADAVKTTIGEAFNNELRSLAKIGTDIMTELNEFLSKHPVFLKSLIAVTAEVGGIALAYKGYIAAKKTMNNLRALSTVLHAAETAAKKTETAATLGQAAATSAATSAQTGLNTAMAANPLGIVLAGVAALTVGIIALVECIKNQKAETEELTAASRVEYEKLQDLKAEYADTCTQYGEASYQAQELKWKVDELSQSYESNKRTVSEYQAEYEATIKAHDEMVQNIQKEEKAVSLECAGILSLVGRLEALSSQSTVTAADQQEILAIITALNKEVPGLSLSYNTLTGSMSQGVDAVKKLAQAEVSRRQHEQSYKDMVKYMQESVEYENKRTEAIKQQKAAQEEVNKAREAMEKVSITTDMQNYQTMFNQANRVLINAEKGKKKHEKEIEYYTGKVAENEEQINRLAKSMAQLGVEADESAEDINTNAGAMSQALGAVKSGYLDARQAARAYGLSETEVQNAVDANTQLLDALESALKAVGDGYLTVEEAAKAYGFTVGELDAGGEIFGIIDSLEKLRESYNTAYEAAYSSIKGQYDLWDKAETTIPTSIAALNSALESQLSYWQNYNKNLENLLARTGEVDGLAEVVASVADGSAKSVNAVAGLAAAGNKELSKMVGVWKAVKEQQESSAESVAKITAQMTGEFNSLKSELEKAVDALNLDSEAAESAKATVDAYVTAIHDGTGNAVAAAMSLRTQVSAALKQSVSESAPKVSRGRHGRYGTEKSGRGGPQLRGFYAAGTDSAKAGLALVGEKGPEIVTFRGGEQVLTAEETRAFMRQMTDGRNALNAYAGGAGEYTQIIALLPTLEHAFDALNAAKAFPAAETILNNNSGGQHIVITVSPSFTVEGGGDIEGKLRKYGDELKAEIIDALDEAGIDARRGVYA